MTGVNLGKLFVCGLVLLPLACSKKKSGSSDEPSSGNSITVPALVSPNLKNKALAATPKGFKPTNSASLLGSDEDAAAAACAQVNSNTQSDAYLSCYAAWDMRSRFFRAGPTQIFDRLADVDSRLNGYIERVSSYRVPCLDPTTTAGREKIAKGGGDVDEDVPAYALKDFDGKTTFAGGHVLDLGRNFSFSCADSFGENGRTMKVFFGRKDGTWNIAQVQKPAGVSDSTPGITMAATLDKDDNMEIFFGIAGAPLAVDTSDNPETSSSLWSSLYSNSAGLSQFVVRPKDNIVAASALMNYSCEQRLIMNDVAVYVEVNGNNYGRCYSGDTLTLASNSAPSYSSQKVALKACLKVSGSAPEPQTTLDLCEESGLLVKDSNGNYENPFAKVGLYSFTSDISQTATASNKPMRAFHGVRILPNLGDGVNPLQLISIPQNTEVKVDGYAPDAITFEKTSDSADGDAGKVTAACNSNSLTSASFTQKWQASVASELSRRIAASSGAGQSSTPPSEADVLKGLQAALDSTGDAAPSVKVRVTRNLGANYRGYGAGTFTVKYDGNTIGTATVDQASLASDVSYTDVTIPLSSIPVLGAAGNFTIEYAGTSTLACNTQTSIQRTANSKSGIPTLYVYRSSATVK
ncbi:MAG: hypothetical protein FJ146_19665 [Deltaproteobacteria bacterium]|nr:hypothetical protein [Deltaproteobacteria bacterium]